MPSIIVADVSFSYGSHLVLDRVSLQVGAGERAFWWAQMVAAKLLC